jgi:hypothetical protein
MTTMGDSHGGFVFKVTPILFFNRARAKSYKISIRYTQRARCAPDAVAA